MQCSPLTCAKIIAIAAIAKPEAMAVASTGSPRRGGEESPLTEVDESPALTSAPVTKSPNRKVAKHSTATALQSSRLRASIDIGVFLSTTGWLFVSLSAVNFVKRVTMCASTSRVKLSAGIFAEGRFLPSRVHQSFLHTSIRRILFDKLTCFFVLLIVNESMFNYAND